MAENEAERLGTVLTHLYPEKRRYELDQMIEVIQAFNEGKKIERRPYDSIVVVEKNGRKNENFHKRTVLSTRGYPAYENENGYIELDDVDHVEDMPWEEYDYPDFNFKKYEYRVKQ